MLVNVRLKLGTRGWMVDDECWAMLDWMLDTRLWKLDNGQWSNG